MNIRLLMCKSLFVWVLLCIYCGGLAQQPANRSIRITVVDAQRKILSGVSVYLLNQDSTVVRSESIPASGITEWLQLTAGKYRIRATAVGYEAAYSPWIDLVTQSTFSDTLFLKTKSQVLENVTVVSKKPPIQFLPDKTVVNPEAAITNAGANAMDVLEKSPGITVSKDGSIIMKGKPAVMVLIDGKQTQLSGADLQAYLTGISASQLEAIELIESPGAKYDAAGNAGIINVKMKSNRQKGFNGSINLSIGQGVYFKTGNSLNLNYRNGKTNWFLNYGNRAGYEKQNMYTLRKYFDKDRRDSALLEQPNFSKTNVLANNLKVGVDFFASKKTTLGLVFTGGLFDREGNSSAAINWMDPDYQIDSIIHTVGQNNQHFKRNGLNINGKHKPDEHSEINIDLDYVRFRIDGDQNYETRLQTTGNSEVQATNGNTRSKLEILTAKADYSRRFNSFLLEAGLKTAINKTNNLAQYYYGENNNWQPDLGRSNNFLYDENISAIYASADAEKGKWHWQTGLRYEFTSYKARQLGNAVVKDSAFKKEYGSLFPTGFVSYQVDSNHTLTFRTGRRIDRPPFQNLNPFLITLNKYTFETGNPYIKPQYTWNFALIHSYKQMFTTEFSYSYLRDYFSQIFIIDSNSSNTNKNVILYTRGNVGSFQNFGITETFQRSIKPWWNLTAVAILNHKIIKGVVWAPFEARITQLNVSLNNQFQFKKGWGFEVSGYYQTKSQIDLQEWLKPQGELDLGVAKQIMKNKGTIKLSVRDLTLFQNYSGYSTFQNAYEPFRVTWDSRVVRLSFNWRFGKAMKPVNRSQGGAAEEINRVGSGN